MVLTERMEKMDSLKPKEPLLAIILAIMVTGFGQVYAGRLRKGILFFFIPILISILLLLYVLNPQTTSNPLLLLILFIGISFAIFVIIDAYRCAKAYNADNNLNRSITAGKRTFYIIGIIFIAFFNPSEIVTKNIALYLRNNVAQAFKIPTETMKPTLLRGDLILADKAIYKKSEPKRGDVIVFIYPQDTKKIFVKRLIGLPGETIEIKNGSIFINGEIVKENVIGSKYYYNKGDYAKERQQTKIPDDGYFVLGDNSASSLDSRYWGFVPKKNLLGKAYKIYYPFDRSGPIK